MGSAFFDSLTELIKAYDIETKSGNKMEMRSNNNLAIYFGNGDLEK